MDTATVTGQDIASAIEGIVPTAHANDRIVTVRPIYVDEVREMAMDLGAVEVQVHPSPLFGRLSVTIWCE
jgi:hypothetical protein